MTADAPQQGKKANKTVIGPTQAEDRIAKAREKQSESWMDQLVDAASEAVGEKIEQLELVNMPDGSRVLQIVVKTDGSRTGHPSTIVIAAPMQHVLLSTKPN